MTTPYPYGTPPAWWGRGRDAAGEAARLAIVLSVRVGDRLRSLAGKKGDVLDLRTSLRRLFADETERAEAMRLLDLAAMMRRKSTTAIDGGLFDGVEKCEE